MEEDGFTLVRKKKQRVKKGRRRQAGTNKRKDTAHSPSVVGAASVGAGAGSGPSVASSPAPADGGAALRSRLATARSFVAATKFFEDVLTAVREAPPPTHFLVLGLGPFSSSRPALHQLAFVLEMLAAKPWGDVDIACSSFDPASSRFEMDVLGEHGVTEWPPDGLARPFHRRTLCYMPHCPEALYSKVVVAQGPHAPSQLLILGNSLQAYTDTLRSKSSLASDDATPVLRHATVSTASSPADVVQAWRDEPKAKLTDDEDGAPTATPPPLPTVIEFPFPLPTKPTPDPDVLAAFSNTCFVGFAPL